MPYKTHAPKILEKILDAQNILLISHERPDGDTLGASLAMSHFLEKIDKNFIHFCHEKPAQYFSFLPRIEHINNDYDSINLRDHDLIITIDCADMKRTKIETDLIKFKNKISLINIDHHISNDNYGHHNLVVTDASSTCEIIFKFFEYHNIAIDKYIATNLLTGIITDTMNFSNASTSQESLRIASELLTKGARVKQIIDQTNQNKNLSFLKLWGKVLSRLEFNSKYNFAYTIIWKKDLEKYNLSIEATDGLANFLSNIQDVDFILVLTEADKNLIKGSLRTTKKNVDVSKLAQALGGGGHQKAAGFKVNGELLKTKSGWQIR